MVLIAKMSTLNDIIKLRQGQLFHTFAEYNVLFEIYKSLYGLDYKIRSTKYIVNDKKFKNKLYKKEIVYSEYHIQCKNISYDNDRNSVECPSEVKLVPRENGTKLLLKVFNNNHNHDLDLLREKDNIVNERQEVTEQIIEKLNSHLQSLNDIAFSDAVDNLNTMIAHDFKLEYYKEAESLTLKKKIVPVIKNDDSSDDEDKSKDCSENSKKEKEKPVDEKNEAHIENINPHDFLQINHNENVESNVASTLPVADKFQETNLSKTKAKKGLDSIAPIKKSQRTIKKKLPFSPSIEAVHKTKLKTTQDIKNSDENIQYSEQEEINLATEAFKNSEDFLDDHDSFQLRLSEDKPFLDELMPKIAFEKKSMKQKLYCILHWLQIPSAAISNCLRMEYKITLQDIKSMNDAIISITNSDIDNMQEYFTDAAFIQILKFRSNKRAKGSIQCPTCNKAATAKTVQCCVCFKKYHLKCIGLKSKISVWYCTDSNCLN